MKTTTKFLVIMLFTSLATSGAFAQIVVRIRPEHPREVVTRPAPPSPNHVWIDEEWAPHGGSYVWHGGYWAAPPRPHAVYIKGHWRNSRRGWIWIPGRWR